MKQDILNLDNKNVGSIELDESIFGLEVRPDILHRVVTWQLARLQSGNHKAKGRSEVALTPAKPFKQKAAAALVRVLSKVRSLEKVVLCSVRLSATIHTN